MNAKTLAQVTGSVAATIIHEHRDPTTGELVTDSVETYTRTEADWEDRTERQNR